MNLYSIHRLTLLAQSILALTVLVAAGALPWAVGAAIGSGILMAERLTYERRQRPGFRQALALLSLLALGFLVVDFVFLSQRLALAIAHLLPYLLFHKHLERIRERDTWQIFLVAAFHPVAAAGLSDDLTQLPFLIAYVAAATAALIAFELKCSSAPGGRPRVVVAPPLDPTNMRALRLGPAEIGAWARALLFGSIFSAAAFVALPRFQVGLMAGAFGKSAMRAGLTSRVELNHVGVVEERKDPVLQIRCKVPPRPTTLWRSVTLEVFDGQRWLPAGRPPELIRRWDGWLDLAEDPGAGRELEISVILLPGSGPELVAAADLVRVFSGRSGALTAAPGGAVLLKQAMRPASYRAVSRLRDRNQTVLIGAKDPYAGIGAPNALPSAERCLLLPRLAPAVQRLAATLNAGHPSAHALAARILRYLKALRYTSRIERNFKLDPTADFLFNQRAGHCEHFASAMAVLLRASRIPARLVNGYRLGAVDPTSGVYLVTPSDAHTWVEALIPGAGWVEFDPSPLVGLERGGAAWWSDFSDSVHAVWDRYVILYSRDDQRALLAWALESGEEQRFLLLVLAVFSLLGVVWIRRQPLAGWHQRPQHELYWRRLEYLLARRGTPITANETVAELAARVGTRDRQAARALALFQAAYEPARYGSAALDAGRVRWIKEAFRQLRDRSEDAGGSASSPAHRHL
jgi:transglutaminase-like putative cysteine protease